MYKNYIFDLYGTLLDIKTDESDKNFWKNMAGFYKSYGADYTAENLEQKYLDLVRSMEQKMSFEKNIDFPEIDIGDVFARLFIEAENKHKSLYFDKHLGASVTKLAKSDLIKDTANIFRALSRKNMRLYDNTLSVLETLKRDGKKIFLLSNAQELFTVPELEMNGLYDFFDDIFISSVKGVKKPQKQFMEMLLEENKLDKNESVMIGNDFQSDIGIAASCGVDSIFLNTDGLSESEMDARLDRFITEKYKDYMPRIITSGDIGEIL